MTTTKKKILAVYITNLGKYNEGELVGEWLELPATNEEIEELMERIGIDGEEYEEIFITDFESDLGITCGEYDSIEELNEMAETIENLDDWERDIVEALISEGGYDIKEAIEKCEDVIVYSDCYNMADVAEQYVETTGLLGDIPESLRYYFDFEAYGRDMEIEGEFIFTDDGNCIQVF